ncbi:hypothetical protein C7M84_012140 [Penaeus vannamei]|uniref:Uncharacterized protein n=1 Tax=Penaeus vannamei TaxID=6689 RepID=A0A3R7QJN0_PENVA|nr:hypothetical protein C7M84_012140 [Penaeus vannamei]
MLQITCSSCIVVSLFAVDGGGLVMVLEGSARGPLLIGLGLVVFGLLLFLASGFGFRKFQTFRKEQWDAIKEEAQRLVLGGGGGPRPRPGEREERPPAGSRPERRERRRSPSRAPLPRRNGGAPHRQDAGRAHAGEGAAGEGRE